MGFGGMVAECWGSQRVVMVRVGGVVGDQSWISQGSQHLNNQSHLKRLHSSL